MTKVTIEKREYDSDSVEILEGERVFQTEFPLFAFFVCQDKRGVWSVVEYISGFSIFDGDNREDVIIESYVRLSTKPKKGTVDDKIRGVIVDLCKERL